MPSTYRKLTMLWDAELLGELQERHAATYAQHRLAFSAWIRSICREWLDATKEAQS